MKLKGLKGLCAGLALAMLTSLAPMNIMATGVTSVPEAVWSDDGNTVTLQTNADLYIYSNSNKDGLNDGDNALNFSTGTTINYMRKNNSKGNNYQEAWTRFDLSKIEIPRGKEIESAKVTVYLSSHKGNDTAGTSMPVNMYALNNQDYDPAKITYSFQDYTTDYNSANAENPATRTTTKTSDILDTKTICENGTADYGKAYDFDATEYLKPKSFTGNETFVFYSPNSKTEGGFYSREYNNGEYAPTLTVTFKDKTEDSIEANADTYIDKKSSEIMSTKTGINFQWQGDNNYRTALARFNLGDLYIPEGKQIASAKISVALTGYYNYNNVPEGSDYTRVGTNVNLSTVTTENYDPATVVWATEGRPAVDQKIATVKVCADDTFTAGTVYEFDITEYIQYKESFGKEAFGVNETFAFTAESNNIQGTFASSENTTYAGPTLTITYKDIDTQILLPIDIASASGRSVEEVRDEDGATCILRNNGRVDDGSDSPYNKAAYIMYNLSDIDVPEGKVITAAELQLYAKPNGESTGQSIRIHNVNDDSWTGDLYNDTTTLIPWAEAPNASKYRAALDAGVSISGTIPVEDGADFKWYSGDVTEFVTSELVNDNLYGCVSFFAFPHKQDNKEMRVKALQKGYEPRLVLTFGEESEITVGTPVVTNSLVVDSAETIAKSGATYVHVPVSGASSAPVNAKVYVAQYRASNDELVGVSMVKDLSLTAGQGKLYFSYYPIGDEDDCYVKVFVWDGNMDSVNDAVASVNMYTEAVTE